MLFLVAKFGIRVYMYFLLSPPDAVLVNPSTRSVSSVDPWLTCWFSVHIAMAESQLPEEIVVNILSRLPVKSLIRFSCVSKRLHTIIFSDPKFARSQFEAACEQKTLSRRLLLSTDAPLLESLDFQTPSFGDDSSVRKLNFPFQQPGGYVRLLGSCNGLVIVAFAEKFFYIWNPTIGLFKQLPDPGFSSISNNKDLSFYGVGYLSATDDYKVCVGCYDFDEDKEEVVMFSLGAHLWKRIQVPGNSWLTELGTLFNEALHWLCEEIKDEIIVFDLAQEEFSKMRLPSFHQLGDLFINLGVSFGGCLCVCGLPRAACDSIDFWVMREYDVRGDSWTKLFNLKLSNLPEELQHYRYLFVLVMESSIVAERWTCNGTWLVRIDQKEEEKLSMYKTVGKYLYMIPYEESLLWIND